MKKLINTSFIYAILGMIGGVFFREFTKLNGFTGVTTLSFLHTHLFMLGMVMFLIFTLMEKQFSITSNKRFNLFFILYNTGLSILVLGLLVRGILQVFGTVISTGISAAISGVAGIGHIILGVAIILFFIIIKKQALTDKE